MKNYKIAVLFLLTALASFCSAQTPIACDGDVSGTLGSPTEVDQYTFSAAAGDIVIIRMQYDGVLIDPKIQLTGPGANQTATAPGLDAAVLGPVQLQGGNYTIAVSDEGSNNAGGYGLSLQVIKPSCAVPIGCTDDVNGSLSKKAEIDAYTFDVSTAGEYVIARMQQDGNTLYGSLQLYKLGATTPIGADIGTLNEAARIDAFNLQPGTYILLAMDEKGLYTGNYGLSVQFVKPSCAVPIGCTDDVNGSLGKKAEIDAFTFDVTAAGDFVVARMQQDDNTLYSRLELFKLGNNTPLYTDDGTLNEAARIDAPNLQPGTYILLAMEEGGIYTGNYGLSVQFVKPSCAVPIGCTDDVNGSLAKKAEIDAFTFDVTAAGDFVVARMQQDDNTLYSRLELFKLGDNTPLYTDAGTLNEAARIDAPNLQPGAYVLLAMEEGGKYTGNYGLSVQFVKPTCAVPIGCTDDVNGSLAKKAEIDAFTFEVTSASDFVVARMQQDGNTLYSRLELFKLGDNTPLYADAGTLNEAARIDAPNLQPGAYVLLAMEEGGKYTGNYGLSVQFVKTACATPLECNGDINGNLPKKAAVNAYHFTINATGTRVIARMMQDGNTLYSRLELYKIGNNSALDEDNGTLNESARVDIVNLQPGDYILLAMESGGTYTGNYGLSLQLIDPGCAIPLDSCRNSLVSNLGKKAEVDAYSFQVPASGLHFIARMQQDGSNLYARLELHRIGATSDDFPFYSGSYSNPARIDEILPAGNYVLLCMDEGGNYTGGYSLSTQFVQPSCATPLNCNGGASGILSNRAEMDAWRIDVSPGSRYLLQFHGKTISGEWRLEFYKQNGQEISALSGVNVASSGSTRLEIAPADLAGVSQMILLVMYNGPYPDDYDLSFQGLRPDCADLLGCSDDIQGNTTLTTEMDAYVLPVGPGDRLQLRLQENVAGSELQLEFFHADGAPWFPAVQSDGTQQLLDFYFPESDTLLVLASDAGIDELVSAYGLSFQLLRQNCASVLNCISAEYSGNLSKQVQTDAYHFQVEPGRRYMIRAKGANASFDAIFRLYSPSGALYTTQNEVNGITEFSQILDSAGTWFILLHEKDGDASGAYTLSFLPLADAACTTQISCGQTLPGNLPQKTSWRQFRLTGNSGYRLIARALGPAASNMRLELFRANGSNAAMSVSGRLDYPLNESGDYYLVVSEQSTAVSGSFHLALQWGNVLGCDQYLAYSQSDLPNLTLPAEMDGYWFEGQSGDVVVFQSGACSGTFDALAELYNAAGQPMISDFTDNGIARLDTFRVPTSGMYKILVMEREGDETGDYGISLQKVNPAVDVPVLTPGLALPGTLSKPAEMRAYTLSAASGTALTLSMTVLSGTIQPRIELYDPNGKRIASGTFGSTTATLTVNSLPLTGVYTALLLSGNACGAGNYEIKWQATLSASPTSLSYNGAGGQSLVTVNGNCPDWAFSNVPSWITISPLSGNGPEVVSITCSPNLTAQSRTATITLSGCGLTQTISITQADATLTATPLLLSVGAVAGQASFYVSGNCADWSVSENTSWLFIDGASSGNAPGPVTINFFDNPLAQARSATITLSGCGQTILVTITQAAANAVLDANPAYIEVDPLGGPYIFDVTGNCTSWTLAENTGWLVLSQSSGNSPATITVTTTANPSVNPRQSSIILTGCGIPPKTITVFQAGVFIEVIPAVINLGSAAGTEGILVEGDCPGWTVSGLPGWMVASPLNGSGQQLINFAFSANPGATPRSAILTITGCDAVFYVNIIQEGAGGITITGDAVICQGESTLLEAPDGYNSYVWSNGATDAAISVSTSGLYSVTVQDGLNVLYGSFSVTVNPLPAQPVISQIDDLTLQASGAGASSWEWYLNGIELPGANGPTIQPAEEGFYSVLAISPFGCKGPLSSEYLFQFVGVGEMQGETQIVIAPNPAREGFGVIISGNTAPVQLVLHDLVGRHYRKVDTSGASELWFDRNDWPPGLYILRLQTPDGQLLAIRKLIWID